jgi:hypothetical protein
MAGAMLRCTSAPAARGASERAMAAATM